MEPYGANGREELCVLRMDTFFLRTSIKYIAAVVALNHLLLSMKKSIYTLTGVKKKDAKPGDLIMGMRKKSAKLLTKSKK
jgi:hypothetical protein